MREINHSHLEYEGAPQEPVTVRVSAINTNHIVTYKLNAGATIVLPKGQVIQFNLKNSTGQRTDLQIFTDGSTPGSNEFVVENVSNCSQPPANSGKCVRRRNVPPRKVTLFAFFVS
ncbi:MAG TPA: hypothetical protein VIT88_13340 [Pyrinomonadaceae bacterium]